MKTIGILGGMGAETSAQFYQLINKIFQNKYQAVQDTDFAHMIIYNCPLIGFTEKGIEEFELVKKQLCLRCKKFRKIWSRFYCYPL